MRKIMVHVAVHADYEQDQRIRLLSGERMIRHGSIKERKS